MDDNSLIARLSRHREEVEAKALIDETIAALKELANEIHFSSARVNYAETVAKVLVPEFQRVLKQ